MTGILSYWWPASGGASPAPAACREGWCAPYNVYFDGDEVAGVFDGDLAGPTTPLMELAFIAWNCVPLWRDMGDDVSAERIRRICHAYGGIHPAHLVDAVPRRIQMMLDWIPLAAAAGDTGLRQLMSQGEPERSQAALNELIPRLRRIRLLLPCACPGSA